MILTTQRMRERTTGCAIVCALLWSATDAAAQHVDILLQIDGGRVATGAADFENTQWTLGQRMWSGPFDGLLFGTYGTDDPGFNARVEDRPVGSDPLTGNSGLQWDFLPMFVDGVRSTLFYWDGSDADMNGLSTADVQFGVQPGYRLNLLGQDTSVSNDIFADESQNRVPGNVVWTTEEDGFLHKHREFRLFDDDEDVGTAPDEGIYLTSLELAIEDALPSEPIFLLFRTPGASSAALGLADDWVAARLDNLVIEGDYNSDGSVGAADYVAWRDRLGSTTNLAGDGDLMVAQGDYAVWAENFGTVLEMPEEMPGGAAGFQAANSVPEPGSWVLAVMGLAALFTHSGRARR